MELYEIPVVKEYLEQEVASRYPKIFESYLFRKPNFTPKAAIGPSNNCGDGYIVIVPIPGSTPQLKIGIEFSMEEIRHIVESDQELRDKVLKFKLSIKGGD